MSKHNSSRRKFIKAAAYTAPVVMTLKAAPSFAKGGSNVNGTINCGVNNQQGVHCKSSGFIKNLNQGQKENAFSNLLKSILKLFGL